MCAAWRKTAIAFSSSIPAACAKASALTRLRAWSGPSRTRRSTAAADSASLACRKAVNRASASLIGASYSQTGAAPIQKTATASAGRRRTEPDGEQRREGDETQEAVHQHEHHGVHPGNIGLRLRRVAEELAPHGGAEAERAEQDQQRARDDGHPVRDHALEELLRADAARQRRKARAHPGRVGPLRREHGAVGRELVAPIRLLRELLGALRQVLRAVLERVGAVLDVLDALARGHATAPVRPTNGRAPAWLPRCSGRRRPRAPPR